MDDAFYEDLGGGAYRATAATAGPWDPAAQHAGPPGALLARAIERCDPRPGTFVARVACDVLGAVPVGDVAVAARVVRPGRSVELVEATLTARGRTAMTARAWRVATNTEANVPTRDTAPPPLPDDTAGGPTHPWDTGYLAATEWRQVRGGFDRPGPATVWARQRIPLVAGEDPTGLQRLLTLADSGNGASWELDLTAWWFINTELTVHLHREPRGEWICLDAATAISPGGAGLATTTLSDVEGPLGRGAQALLVARR